MDIVKILELLGLIVFWIGLAVMVCMHIVHSNKRQAAVEIEKEKQDTERDRIFYGKYTQDQPSAAIDDGK